MLGEVADRGFTVNQPAEQKQALFAGEQLQQAGRRLALAARSDSISLVGRSARLVVICLV